jgi:hypothetical protein
VPRRRYGKGDLRFGAEEEVGRVDCRRTQPRIVYHPRAAWHCDRVLTAVCDDELVVRPRETFDEARADESCAADD